MSAASIARALSGRRSGRGWTARCPAHDDRDPSLSISISQEGKTLVHCHAGCSVRIIVPPDRGSDFNDLLMQQVNSDGALDVG